jgi:uncharacterized protein YdiU (UPF0061 family)
VVATGEPVYREATLPGAILTRVAASHLRVGTFEYFAARDEREQLRQLADYASRATIRSWQRRTGPALAARRGRAPGGADGTVDERRLHPRRDEHRQHEHPGESIDFGPCAFMEAYHPGTVFSSIDQHGRYAYANQPGIAQWNLARLAETILPLLADDEDQAVDIATEVILAGFGASYRRHWLAGVRAKLGLQEPGTTRPIPRWPTDWLALLQDGGIDYTLAWRHLADATEGRAETLHALFADTAALDAWLARWQQRGRSRGTARGAARAGNAAGESAHHRAQPSRRGSPRSRIQRGRSRPLRSAAAGACAAL